MEKLTFYKMSGSGNDFIIIDNRKAVVDEALGECADTFRLGDSCVTGVAR